MYSFTGKEIYIPKKDFVDGFRSTDGIITNIQDDRCVIGDHEWFHFPIQKEICLCQIRKPDIIVATATKEFNIDDVSTVVNPAKIMNERFVRQDVDDLKGINLPPQNTGKTWTIIKKEIKGRKKMKKLLEEI